MGGRVGHAELDLNGATVMLSDEFPDHGAVGPATLKGTSVALLLFVADANAAFKKAVAAGGKIRRAVTDEFYGDRTGQIEDPFGHVWFIQQRLEEVSPKVMQKRLDQMMAQTGSEPATKSAKPAAKRKKT